MKIHGTKTEISTIEVDVKPHDALKSIKDLVFSTLSPGDAEYIDEDGRWTRWSPARGGSGATTYYGQASDEAIGISAAFDTIAMSLCLSRNKNKNP